jgi:hypothetical protein
LDKIGILPQILKYGVYGLTFRKIGEEKGQVKQDCEYVFKEEKSEKLALKNEKGNKLSLTHKQWYIIYYYQHTHIK